MCTQAHKTMSLYTFVHSYTQLSKLQSIDYLTAKSDWHVPSTFFNLVIVCMNKHNCICEDFMTCRIKFESFYGDIASPHISYFLIVYIYTFCTNQPYLQQLKMNMININLQFRKSFLSAFLTKSHNGKNVPLSKLLVFMTFKLVFVCKSCPQEHAFGLI